MKAEHLQLGEAGESEAARYLLHKGMEMVMCNYKVPFGEIDLIMREKDTLVFVEVRTKTNPEHGHPLETITPSKKSRLIKTAFAYLKENGQYDCFCRFDVVAMIPGEGMDWQIEHIENAFEITQFS